MKQIQREHDTAKERRMQVVMPLNLGLKLPEDDSLSLLIEITEEMDYRELNAAYERREAAGEASAKQLFQLVTCGFMNGHYSLRKMRDACRYDLRMIYLLRGRKAPSHERFGDFIRHRLTGDVMENLFYQLVTKLLERGHISLENLFVDGTKIEANANRYSFVWGKAVSKNEEKMQAKLQMKLLDLQTEYNAIETPPTLQDMLTHLYKLKAERKVTFVSGKGCRKSKLQKDIEELEECRRRQEKYDAHKAILNGRSSYSKTDHDATFMRMKEDPMKNGQLKPGYNLQIGVSGEFAVTAGLSSERSDMLTLMPLMKRMKEKLEQVFTRVIADAGYESEENYKGLKEMGVEAYIKPSNYEKGKTRAYRANRFRAENMPYDDASDSFTCPNGKQLTLSSKKHSKSKSGFISEVSVYRCLACADCPMRKLCTKSASGRTIQRSEAFWAYRAEAQARITTELGTQLRMNRSIQSEGIFGVLKQDWGFRRFLRRGSVNVFTEVLLYLFAFNVAKLHSKIQRQKDGVIIHQLKAS